MPPASPGVNWREVPIIANGLLSLWSATAHRTMAYLKKCFVAVCPSYLRRKFQRRTRGAFRFSLLFLAFLSSLIVCVYISHPPFEGEFDTDFLTESQNQHMGNFKQHAKCHVLVWLSSLSHWHDPAVNFHTEQDGPACHRR